MDERKMIRLSQAARQLNTDISKIVEHFGRSGVEIENKPNSKITQEQYLFLKNTIDSELRFDLVSPKSDTKSSQASLFEGPKSMQIDFEFPDYLTDEQIKEIIAKTLLKVDNMHRDLGGRGLKVKDLQVLLQEKLQEVIQ